MRLLLILILCISAPAVLAQASDPVVQRLEQAAALIGNNRLVEAERQLTAIARTTPNSPVVLNLMGTIRAKQKRLNEAESLFLQALRNDETFKGARMNLVYLYLLKGDADKASFQLKRSEEHTSELQSRLHLVCRLL